MNKKKELPRGSSLPALRRATFKAFRGPEKGEVVAVFFFGGVGRPGLLIDRAVAANN